MPSETVIIPSPSPTPKIAQVQTPAPIPTLEFQFGVKYPAKVVYVYDGDTIKVNLSGQILVIRLLGVDTPEKSVEKNKPYEYDAITNLTYLAEWGRKAKNFAYAMLYNKTVYIEFDETAGLKGYYGRYLAYVYLENGTDFNALLVKNGLARVYKEGECKKEAYYLQLEEIAKTNKTGFVENCWMILKRYPLTTLFTLLFLLNILDYLPTIYALENIPNAYEANPWIKTPDVIFRFKILYGIPIGIAGVLLAFSFERLGARFRAEIEPRFIDYWYYLWLAFVLVVFVDYIFTVAGNVNRILRCG